jgi:hypothetical protein
VTVADQHRRLDDHREAWISLAINHGEPFRSHAVREILRGVPYMSAPYDICSRLVYSALAREDADSVRVKVNDWSEYGRARSAPVYKWIPGSHFYALDEKFDGLESAKDHLRMNGYVFSGLVERHVYGPE